jgi:hypothetical protein
MTVRQSELNSCRRIDLNPEVKERNKTEIPVYFSRNETIIICNQIDLKSEKKDKTSGIFDTDIKPDRIKMI